MSMRHPQQLRLVNWPSPVDGGPQHGSTAHTGRAMRLGAPHAAGWCSCCRSRAGNRCDAIRPARRRNSGATRIPRAPLNIPSGDHGGSYGIQHKPEPPEARFDPFIMPKSRATGLGPVSGTRSANFMGLASRFPDQFLREAIFRIQLPSGVLTGQEKFRRSASADFYG